MRLDFAPAHEEKLIEAEGLAGAPEGLGADDGRPHRAEDALRGVREGPVQVVGHDELDDRVAEIFQALVRAEGELFVLVQVGAVDERLLQNSRVAKVDAERLLGLGGVADPFLLV